jgi:TIR domain
MPHVFISYSSKDSELARQLYEFLVCSGAKPFLAEIDLQGGDKWKEGILENLRQSEWVFFLATPNSCKSQAVAHEIGASLILHKKFIPLMWQVSPKELPEWVDDTHAVDLKDPSQIQKVVGSVARTIKSNEFWKGVIVTGLICFGLWVLAKMLRGKK